LLPKECLLLLRHSVRRKVTICLVSVAAVGVTLDYLAGLSDHQVDAATLNKIIEIQSLNEADRKHIMTTIDALLRDAKARNAYA
jgi:hypothetical protein